MLRVVRADMTLNAQVQTQLNMFPKCGTKNGNRLVTNRFALK